MNVRLDIDKLRDILTFPIDLFEVFAEDFYWMFRFLLRIALKVRHGAPMSHATLEEANKEIMGERQRKMRWEQAELDRQFEESKAFFEQLASPYFWAWQFRNNCDPDNSLGLSVEEMVRIIGPIEEGLIPEETVDRLFEYINRKRAERDSGA